ncbi:rod shape-determining protein RodA [Lottiidibacillus patelloidae]|uniref:Rod shape-determining protein RodA n=1 Tax=Lottiidibacillus patelloidae TaxID=2670334 RepID=A0A263BX17_9BACI|nr:FtsW/RodA/SpoVE family cell cycle protein [Lottiidibacillus patelloidae]OZM58283.1 rod shape-determining protein RodA [Lottiidibacillus patelloidae]
MKKDLSTLQQIDYVLLFIMFLMLCVSIISINSAPLSADLQGINFVAKQLMWYAIGSIAIVGTMLLDYDRYKMINWYLYGLGLLLLIGLELRVPGAIARNGAFSWYEVPGIGDIQPSEFMKIFLIITLSTIIVKHHEIYEEKTVQDDFLLFGKILLASSFPLALVMKQPDLGTAMVLTAIIITMILVSGIRWRFLFGFLGTIVLFISTLVYIYLYIPSWFPLEDYQLNRFYAWLDPYEDPSNIGYQTIKSIQANGSGMLFGRGYNEGVVPIPEAHTDFIFAVIGEEFGFIGGSIVISLFFILIYRMIHVGLESHDPFGSYLCAGVIGMLTFQVFQNVGMTIRLLPITGIPLPFISYGGSSLLTYMIAIGLILNVRSRKRTYMFD